jgi:hypothetical protein
MDLREIGWGGWSGFTWLRIGTVGGLLWMRWWTFGFWCHGVSYSLNKSEFSCCQPVNQSALTLNSPTAPVSSAGRPRCVFLSVYFSSFRLNVEELRELVWATKCSMGRAEIFTSYNSLSRIYCSRRSRV